MKSTNMQDIFGAWIGDAKKGDEFVYAASSPSVRTISGRTQIADQAWRYSEKGLVNLVQRRTSHRDQLDGGGTFDYIAQRTGRVA